MKAFVHRIKLTRAIAAATYKEWAAYRTHSMVSIFVGPVYFLVMVLIWTSLYTGVDTINGMSLEQMITYYGISTLIGYATMDFAGWNFQMLIRTGKFITFALRPVHHRYFALSQKLGHRTLGLIFEFIPVLLIFVFIFKINLMPYNMLFAVISIILSFLMTFYVNYTIGLTAFWFTNTRGIVRVYQLLLGVFSGSLLPLSFFPERLQRIMFFLPFQYINYIPSMVYTGNTQMAGRTFSMPEALIYQGIYAAVMLVISELLYRAGLRRFTGVGA